MDLYGLEPVPALNRYDGYSVKTYQKKIKDPNSLSDDFINSLLFTDDNKLWIGTASGLTIYDMANDTFIRWFHKENDPQSIASNDVRKIVQDAQKNLWIAAGGRVTQYSPLTNQYTHYPSLKEPPLSDILDMVFDNKGRLWMTSGSWGENANGGLYVIKPGSFKVESIPWPSDYNGKPVSHSLFGMAFDPSGYIWCSSFSGMLFKIHIDTYAIQMMDDLMKQGADQNLCSSICCDNRGRTWFATRFTGVAMYESSRDTFKFFKHYPFVQTSVNSSTLDVVSNDRSGMIWVGTSGKGVDRFHPDRQYFTSIYSGADITSSLPSPWVRCFTENAQNQLLIGTTQGLSQYDLHSNSFLTYQKDPTNPGSISFSSIRALLKDRHGNIWVGTASGLNLMMAGEKSFIRFMRNRNDPYAALTSFCYSIIEDMPGNIWVAGDGGLELVDLAKKDFIIVVMILCSAGFPGVHWPGAPSPTAREISGLATRERA
jgi:ligand-binding sensor domain-containing protein